MGSKGSTLNIFWMHCMLSKGPMPQWVTVNTVTLSSHSVILWVVVKKVRLSKDLLEFIKLDFIKLEDMPDRYSFFFFFLMWQIEMISEEPSVITCSQSSCTALQDFAHGSSCHVNFYASESLGGIQLFRHVTSPESFISQLSSIEKQKVCVWGGVYSISRFYMHLKVYVKVISDSPWIKGRPHVQGYV